MGSKADRKPKEVKPKESFLSPEQRKLKMRKRFAKGFKFLLTRTPLLYLINDLSNVNG